jgi:hypothetical protein
MMYTRPPGEMTIMTTVLYDKLFPSHGYIVLLSCGKPMVTEVRGGSLSFSSFDVQLMFLHS